eukprot:1175365-Prorocentrum_minimum.AAC.1
MVQRGRSGPSPTAPFHTHAVGGGHHKVDGSHFKDACTGSSVREWVSLNSWVGETDLLAECEACYRRNRRFDRLATVLPTLAAQHRSRTRIRVRWRAFRAGGRIRTLVFRRARMRRNAFRCAHLDDGVIARGVSADEDPMAAHELQFVQRDEGPVHRLPVLVIPHLSPRASVGP